ncbi:MAG: DNA replication/repair protein RecF [Acutalibacteraceae bacterium]|nr:DNA replication/repair protein RecF [Acutalibacteraceae bacterium]
MIIKHHSAKNFRNIDFVEFDPHPEMNVIYGENGQGKTNIIESIWLLTGFYSFRARKNAQLIKQGTDEAEIENNFYSHSREQLAVMKINKRKEITLNGIKEESPRVMMGKYYAVVFSPATLGLVQDGPGERRKMLDIALSLIKPNYAVVMSRYLRVLEQRNALLKKMGERSFDYDYMVPWDTELANLGTKIIKYRLDYVEQLSALSAEIYNGISSGREKFDFYYDFSKENISEEQIKEKLVAEIEKSREADIKRLYTNAGPHTHDIVLNLNGRDARVFGSQGQQRSCALAMKLGEASIIEKITGECPVVLLDDVMSELDEGRQTFILNYLDNWQVFITCCDPSTLLRSKKGKAFEVVNGEIKEME